MKRDPRGVPEMSAMLCDVGSCDVAQVAASRGMSQGVREDCVCLNET